MTPRPTLEPQPKVYFTANVTTVAKQYAKDIFHAMRPSWASRPIKMEEIQEHFWQLVGRQIVAREIKAGPRRGPCGLSENIAIGILYALDELDAPSDGGGSDKRRAIKELLKVVTVDGRRVD